MISISIPFLFCGCEKYSDYQEPEQNLFVSALGIDQTKSGITVYAESAETQPNNNEKNALLSGFGETLPEAMNNLRTTTPLKFDLSHCAIIAIGKRTKDTEKILCEYILSRPEDMLSVYMVACDNAKELLSCGGASPVGYELSSALKKNYYAGEIRTPSTVMDILNNREGFYVPYFSVGQNAYTFSGAAYYKGLTRVCLKSADEVRLINILRDEFARGFLTLEDESFDIQSSNLSVNTTDKAINILLSIELNFGDKTLLENKLKTILNEFKNDYSLNIFGFCKNGKLLQNDTFSKMDIKLTLEVNKIAS